MTLLYFKLAEQALVNTSIKEQSCNSLDSNLLEYNLPIVEHETGCALLSPVEVSLPWLFYSGKSRR